MIETPDYKNEYTYHSHCTDLRPAHVDYKIMTAAPLLPTSIVEYLNKRKATKCIQFHNGVYTHWMSQVGRNCRETRNSII